MKQTYIFNETKERERPGDEPEDCPKTRKDKISAPFFITVRTECRQTIKNSNNERKDGNNPAD